MKWLPLFLLCACATPLTAEGKHELTRETIHGRHSWCTQRADLYSQRHGYDAMAYFFCDAEATKACVDAGLERQCGQWIGDMR